MQQKQSSNNNLCVKAYSHTKTIIIYCHTKLGMRLVNLGQFNWDIWEFVNFPDFCGDATTVVLYLNNSD